VAADPAAAAHALAGTVPSADLTRTALLTDGLSRAVELYRTYTWPQLLDELATVGPAALLARLRGALREMLLRAPPAVVAGMLGYAADRAEAIAAESGSNWKRYAAGDHTRIRTIAANAPAATARTPTRGGHRPWRCPHRVDVQSSETRPITAAPRRRPPAGSMRTQRPVPIAD
jgi:hypothetical protein